MTWTYPELIERVRAVLPPGLSVQTQLPPDQSAWLSVPIFGFAKHLNEPLPTVARGVAKNIEALGDVTVEVIGGFVNITPNEPLVTQALTEATARDFGTAEIGNGETVLVELSSPNIAKPMGIGHLRSTVIGDALQRVYRALGYQVVSINHLGDWGTQFGKLIVAYEHQFSDLVPRSVTIPQLMELYVKFHEDAEADPALDDLARAMFKRLEDGDPAVRALWQTFVDASLTEFQRVYDRLGVVIDEPTMGESRYESMVNHIVDLAQERNVVETSDGALIVRIPNESTPLILRKTDGATIYATRDLAALHYRIETYQPNRILYVVANEQALHFRQLFSAAGLLGIVPDGVRLEHIKFGLVRTVEGKLSTRRGKQILLEDVLNEAVERAKIVLAAREQTTDQLDQIAETVGVGAVKYFDLMHDRNHDVVFDWDRMLNLKGDSAPYLLYSYTRAAAILRKTRDGARDREIERDRGIKSADLSQHSTLIRTIARFPNTLEMVIADNAPHHLAQYLNQLASEFHRFYEEYPVLKSEGTEREARLAIVAATANVLKRGLDLLGINVLKEM